MLLSLAFIAIVPLGVQAASLSRDGSKALHKRSPRPVNPFKSILRGSRQPRSAIEEVGPSRSVGYTGSSIDRGNDHSNDAGSHQGELAAPHERMTEEDEEAFFAKEDIEDVGEEHEIEEDPADYLEHLDLILGDINLLEDTPGFLYDDEMTLKVSQLRPIPKLEMVKAVAKGTEIRLPGLKYLYDRELKELKLQYDDKIKKLRKCLQECHVAEIGSDLEQSIPGSRLVEVESLASHASQALTLIRGRYNRLRVEYWQA